LKYFFDILLNVVDQWNAYSKPYYFSSVLIAAAQFASNQISCHSRSS